MEETAQYPGPTTNKRLQHLRDRRDARLKADLVQIYGIDVPSPQLHSL